MDQRGDYVIQLTVSDGKVSSTDTVLVSTQNGPPTANAGLSQTVHAGSVVQLDGSASFDPDNDPLGFTWSLLNQPSGSAAVLSDPFAINPIFTADKPGLYTSQLIVNDGRSDSAPATVNTTATNTDPVAADDSATTSSDTPVSISVLGNDTDLDNDTLSVQSVTVPAHGTAVIVGTQVRYTPTAAFAGDDAFSYTISDGLGGTATARVTVTVSFVDTSPPTAALGVTPNPANAGATVTLDGSGSVDAAPGAIVGYAFTLVSAPAGYVTSNGLAVGVAARQDTPSRTFVPNVGGSYVVQLVVNDGRSDSTPATVTVAVSFVDDLRPTALLGVTPNPANAGATVTLDGSDSVDEAPGAVVGYAFTLVSAPTGYLTSNGLAVGATVLQDTPSLAFVPNVAGSYVVQLVVSDGAANDSTPASATLNVVGSTPTQPIDVQPVLDSARAASALIGRAGGTITTAGMTLAIPQGALTEDTQITVTPLLGLVGSPLDGQIVGALFAPDGLALLQPASLSFAAPAGTTPGDVLGFAFNGSGQDLHLTPHKFLNGTVELEIWHFSGAGGHFGRFVNGVPIWTPGSAETQARHEISLAQQACAASGDPNSEACSVDLLRREGDALLRWYADAVEPALRAALGAPSFQVEEAIEEWRRWGGRVIEFYEISPGQGEIVFGSRMDESRELATTAVANMAYRRLENCTGTDLPSQLRDIIRVSDLAGPAGIDLTTRGLPSALNGGLLKACASIRIDTPRFPSVAARGDGNTLSGRAYFATYAGPVVTTLPLEVTLTLDNAVSDASRPALGPDGGFETQVYPSAGAAGVLIRIDVQLAPGALPDLDPFYRPELSARVDVGRPARDRVELEPLTGSSTTLIPGGTTPLRVRVAGDGMESATVGYSLSGPGELSTASGVTNGLGEAPSFAYRAPASTVNTTATVTATFGDAQDTVTLTIQNPPSPGEIYEGVLTSETLLQWAECPPFSTCLQSDRTVQTWRVRITRQTDGRYVPTGQVDLERVRQLDGTCFSGSAFSSTTTDRGTLDLLSQPFFLNAFRLIGSGEVLRLNPRACPEANNVEEQTLSLTTGGPVVGFVVPGAQNPVLVIENGIVVALTWDVSDRREVRLENGALQVETRTDRGRLDLVP